MVLYQLKEMIKRHNGTPKINKIMCLRYIEDKYENSDIKRVYEISKEDKKFVDDFYNYLIENEKEKTGIKKTTKKVESKTDTKKTTKKPTKKEDKE